MCLVCLRTNEENIHLHLLIIFSQTQRQGLGSLVMQKLRNDVHKQNLALTLSCFKQNKPALCLYRKLGFRVESEDENFYDFTSDIGII